MFAVAAMLAFNVSADDKKPAKKGRGGIQAMIKQLDLTADQKKALAKHNKENKERVLKRVSSKARNVNRQ